jgi:predicted metal-dependent hydrolase
MSGAARDAGRISIDGVSVAYLVRRSRRRRAIGLAIDERGLCVGAPWHATQPAIERALQRHAAWIVRTLAEWRARRPPPRLWRDGETLMLLGERLRLTLEAGAAAVRLDGDRLIVAGAPAAVESEVVGWLRRCAFDCFTQRIEYYRPRLGLAAPALRLSQARTRWGSCHACGRISLNWRLVQMPLRLIDYVVAHELAHLRHMDHTPRFWATVAQLVPDHRARRAELRREAHRYLLG